MITRVASPPVKGEDSPVLARGIHQWFEARVVKTPDAVALVFGHRRLSYAALNQRANAIAHELIGGGAGPESLVAVFMDRSPAMLAAMLAVLKTGAAYVPIDPDYPARRVAFMLKDAGVSLTLTRPCLRQAPALIDTGCAIVELGVGFSGPDLGNPAVDLDPFHLGYVLFTSGSTGKPKGVAIGHGAVLALLQWAGHEFGRSRRADVLASTSICFDLSVFEIFLPLCHGGTVVLVKNAFDLPAVEAPVSLINTVPSAARELLRMGGIPTSVETVNLAGEPLRLQLVQELYRLPHVREVYNLYGPSEDTTYSIFVKVAASCRTEPPIGMPVSGTQALILDGNGVPVKVGDTGELFLAGSGLARGYLGRPDLTAERFPPFSGLGEQGSRMYRTGDLVKRGACGRLYFLGRLDHQVKIRGFRVELGEIEAALRRYPEVRDALVVEYDKRLAAYLEMGDLAASSEPRPANPRVLRTYLRLSLPDYMIPAAFTALRRFPLTPNGKLDRAALPPPEMTAAADLYTAPRDDWERDLARIWSEVLGVGRVGIHDNFFELGGDSIRATQILTTCGRAGLGLSAPQLFEMQTIARLAELRSSGSSVPFQRESTSNRPASLAGEGLAFNRRIMLEQRFPEAEDIYAATAMQQGMLFHGLYDPDSRAYLDQFVFSFARGPEPVLFRETWSRLIQRHAALRTLFALSGESCAQVVLGPGFFPWTTMDWSALPRDREAERLDRFLEAETEHGFSPTERPPLRLHLILRAGGGSFFVFSFHHALLDGWSLPILMRETSTIYRELLAGRQPVLAKVRPYRDYVALLERRDRKADRRHWRARLEGFEPTAPWIVPPRESPSIEDARISLHDHLDAADFQRMRAFSAGLGITLNTLVQGAWALLLGRYAAADEVLFGVTVAARPPELEGVAHMVGLFLNTLPLRVRTRGNPEVAVWLRELQTLHVNDRLHESAPLVEIQAQGPVPAGQPLFESLVTFENFPASQWLLGGWSEIGVDRVRERERTHYPLSLKLEPDGVLNLSLIYDPTRVDGEFAARVLQHFRNLMDALCESPVSGIAGLTLSDEAERRLLLESWSGSWPIPPQPLCFHELLENRVRHGPRAEAIRFGENGLSYEQLNARANRLARHLRALGVGPDVPVGLRVERVPEMMIGILAILKAGGAYLPLDPEYPEARVRYMLADAGAPLLLTLRALHGSAGQELAGVRGNTLCLDEEKPPWSNRCETNPDFDRHASQTAYIIYTSGSTGAPKGVAVPHASLSNHARVMADLYALEASDRVLQFCSISFDKSVEELFPTLYRGATLVLHPHRHGLSTSELSTLFRTQGITVAQLPTAYWHNLTRDLARENQALAPCLRLVVAGGEKADPEVLALWRRIAGKVSLVNGYGPTETTVTATCYVVHASERPPWLAILPIGRPVPQYRLHLADARLELVAAGVPGELLIAGAGLARGYLNSPALTASAFVPNPFASPGERLYRSGDRVRFLPDANLIYLGRFDRQVKLRGFRIELGEIESALRERLSNGESLVLAGRAAGGDRQLTAFLRIGKECADLDQRALRRSLRSSLPEYMIPTGWLVLEAFPRKTNGKIDRAALARMAHERVEHRARPDRHHHAPRTPTQKTLAAIWSQLLAVPAVGLGDSFFELGGHSLLAVRLLSRVRERLGLDLSMKTLFARPLLEDLAAHIDALARARSAQSAARPLPVPGNRRFRQGLPLSPAQERLWFLDRLDPGAPTYNIPTAYHLAGVLDVASLRARFQELVDRHEIMRTRFDRNQRGEPVQIVLAETSFSLPVIDVSRFDRARADALSSQNLSRSARLPFSLDHAPLFRLRLYRLGPRDHILSLNIHHIISDGWSIELLLRDWATLYRGTLQGRPAVLPDPPIQYADYSQWQRDRANDPLVEEQLAYWERRLADTPTVLEIPTDRPRPAFQSFKGGICPLELDEETVRALERWSTRQGGTLFMALLSVFATWLSRYSGQDDLCVGTPTANRGHVVLESLPGFFVNTLVMRVELRDRPSFSTLLRRVRRTTLEAWAHEEVSFDRVVERLRPSRDLSRTPLFQVLFSLERIEASGPQSRWPGLTLSPRSFDYGIAKFDLSLYVAGGEGRPRAFLEYNADLFHPTTVARMARQIQTLTAGLIAATERPAGRVPMLSDEELHGLLREWNGRSQPFAESLTLARYFELQAQRTPAATALVAGGITWTYAELNRRAEAIAAYLRRLGVMPETPVALCLPRCSDLVACMLAVFKAGGCYVPLDPAYPASRLSFTLEDARARVLLTLSALVEGLPPSCARVVAVDHLPPNESSPIAPGRPPNSDHTAYILFTSGSTGRPKGVAIAHRSVIAMLTWARAEYGEEARGSVLAATSICFDLSVFELFLPLLCGGRVVLVANALALTDLEEEVTLVNTVPSAITELLRRNGIPASVTTINLAGEPLRKSLVAALYRLPHVGKVYNLYGPSEDTTYSTFALVPRDSEDEPAIGRPLTHSSLYLLNRELELAPPGCPGELCMAGAGLARGYWSRPELTAVRFVPDPFSSGSGSRLYRCGDLARFRANARLEFLGRLDHQVKIRGFRIELGEVESVLREHPRVGDAVVVARASGNGAANQQLVAYLECGADQGADAGEGPSLSAAMRGYLKSRLPEFMIPAFFIPLRGFPRTPNGKLDRLALPEPEPLAESSGYTAPANEVEAGLSAIWQEVLGLPRIGVHDNFFELGGHSLIATRIVSRALDQFGLDLPLREFFAEPTIARCAALIGTRTERDDSGGPRLQPVPRDQPLPLSFGQERLWFLDRLKPGNPAYNLPVAFKIEGSLNRAVFQACLDRIYQRHEAVRTRFQAGDGKRGTRPVQVIDPPGNLPLKVIDLRHTPRAQRERACLHHLRAQAIQPFSLAKGPLLRVTLYQLGPQRFVLLINMHHIIGDGWSIRIWMNELAILYRAALNSGLAPNEPAAREMPCLPELPIQYADFAVWQRRLLRGALLEKQLAYWQKRLAGLPSIIELPLDRPRPALQTFHGAFYSFELDPRAMTALETAARGQGATPFMALLALFGALLSRYVGQVDLAIGTPIANRHRTRIENLIGFFANTVVMRLDLTDTPQFRQLLARVRRTALDGYAHQDVPFERVVDRLKPERDAGRTPLFQVVFALETEESGAVTLPGLRFKPCDLDFAIAKFDLSLFITRETDRVQAVFEYNTDLFDAGTPARMARHLRNLLAIVTGEPDVVTAHVDLLDEDERHLMLLEWNDFRPVYPRGLCLHQAFELQVETTPHAIALMGETRFLSYAELNRCANRLARHLMREGVYPGDPVGILMKASFNLVTGLLAILKAGGAYVPLDPAYPAERLAFMTEDSGMTLMLATRETAPDGRRAPTSVKKVYVEDAAHRIGKCDARNVGPNSHPLQPAYIMYTSGSTGRPKGVTIPHRNVVCLAHDTSLGNTSSRNVFAQISNPSFDALTYELWTVLLNGCRLWLTPARVLLDIRRFVRALNAFKIDHLFVTTAFFNHMTRRDPDTFVGLKQVIFGGEAADPGAVKPVMEGHRPQRLINAYGPTETTTFSTIYPIAEPAAKGAAVPIGRPVGHTDIFLVDRPLNPVPVGVAGELLIGGDGLAQGYWNRPALTAERFIPHPFTTTGNEGGRLYATGDLARYLPDGRITFVGRRDHQVKIRGFRIELGEIETVLAEHPRLSQAAVLVREPSPGHRVICAHVVPLPSCGDGNGPLPGPAALRAYLESRLPRHMVPSFFFVMDGLPLTPNGKLDRSALLAMPEPGAEQPRGPSVDMLGPARGIERILIGIWREVLGLKSMHTRDNFFDLGGHSLAIVNVHGRLQRALDRDVPLVKLFEFPTIAALADYLEPTAPPPRTTGPEPLPDGEAQRLSKRKRALQRKRNQRRAR